MRERKYQVLGIDLSTRRNAAVTLSVLSALISAFLTSHFYLANISPHGASITFGRQSYTQAIRLNSLGAGGTQSGGNEIGGLSEEDSDLFDELGETSIWDAPFVAGTWNPRIWNGVPISEITVMSCILNVGSVCRPKSTIKEDTLRGEWIRVEQDMNRQVGLYYLYLFYRRLLPNSRQSVVTDLKIFTHPPTLADLPSSSTSIWSEVPTSVREGLWPQLNPRAFIHYRRSTQVEVLAARKLSEDGLAGELEPITEIELMYGQTHAAWGFKLIEQQVTGGKDDPKAASGGDGKRAGLSLSLRRQKIPLPKAPELRFDRAGKFRIMQVADLHLSTGPGDCRDMSLSATIECNAVGADVYSLEWLKKSLDELKPDLVVFTGDQLNGQTTSWAAHSTILKFAPLIWERKLPWVVIFGNHDGENDYDTNASEMELYRSMPGCLSEAGPEGVEGIGNYVRGIRDHRANTTLFNLYFLDSHANAPKSGINIFKNPGYDFIKPSQINWFKSESSRATPILRPYSPSTSRRPISARYPQSALTDFDEDDPLDEPRIGMMPSDGSRITDGPPGSKTLDDLTEEEKEEIAAMKGFELDDDLEDGLGPIRGSTFRLPAGPTKENPIMAKPNAMAFFHIPLIESYDGRVDEYPSKKVLKVGERLEGNGASKTNSGFFNQVLRSQREVVVPDEPGSTPKDEFWDGEFTARTSGRPEIKVVANGHCHISSDCRRVEGVWLCFGGGGSYAGYGKAEFARRFRVYDLSDFGETIATFQFTDELKKIDLTVLTGEGAPE